MNLIKTFILSILIIIFFSMNIRGQILTMTSSNNPISSIDSLYNDYKNTFIRACFSIEELRSFSIINIDKISREYDNEWISPDEIVSKLNLKEQKQLIEVLKGFISDLNDIKKSESLVIKLNQWCILDMHLKFISNHYGITQRKLVEFILKTDIEFTDPITGTRITQSSHSVEQLYYIAINNISSLPQKQIFTFFKQLFGVLAQS